ncbi:TOMM precursor leader peptide-binding protein [Tumebacillus sp. BK434]|uniref:TOMM precursor leader peptide-binding protein n=1 Tax=Tumebacillus sp. BK434 TaxID=2512169 RepID=UPI0014051AD6|nr:TOMM precursor leader peptide-binding protein [Tumebacillus sp. BK434]
MNSYYKLREGYFFTFPERYELQVRHVHWGESLARVGAAEGETWLQDVFGELDGTRKMREIMAVVPEERQEDCLKMLAALRRSFLDESPTPIPNDGPWSARWLPKLMGTRHTTRHFYERELAEANILVLGAGMIGSRLATGLVQLGAGHVAVADGRTVTPDDRFHSMAYVDAELGAMRAEALAGRLNRLAGGERASGHVWEQQDRAGLDELIDGRTLVLVAEDAFSPALYEQVNQAALRRKITWSMIVIDGWNVHVGPTFLPGRTGCYHCLEADRRSRMANPVSYDRYVGHLVQTGMQAALSISPTFADLAAGMLASDVPNLIGNMPQRIETESGLTLGRQMQMDMRTFDAALHTVVKQPRCAVCRCGAAEGKIKEEVAT